jgi:hypothetical protein
MSRSWMIFLRPATVICLSTTAIRINLLMVYRAIQMCSCSFQCEQRVLINPSFFY